MLTTARVAVLSRDRRNVLRGPGGDGTAAGVRRKGRPGSRFLETFLDVWPDVLKLVSRSHWRAAVSANPSFKQLLTFFDTDLDRAGARYRDLHRRLVKFFEWQGLREPEEHADEALDRLLRKIAGGEPVANVDGYALAIARCVSLEARKRSEREAEILRLVPQVETEEPRLGDDDAERQQECFERCLATLSATNREIILRYYTGERREKIEARRTLAQSLGIDLNALRVRAHRIRSQLETCVAQRLFDDERGRRPVATFPPGRPS